MRCPVLIASDMYANQRGSWLANPFPTDHGVREGLLALGESARRVVWHNSLIHYEGRCTIPIPIPTTSVASPS